MVAGLKPQVGPTAFLHCIKMPLAFLYTFSMCSFHDSFESRMLPKKFVDFCTSISMPSTLRGLLNDQFLLLVNLTQWVLRWLSLSPLLIYLTYWPIRLIYKWYLAPISETLMNSKLDSVEWSPIRHMYFYLIRNQQSMSSAFVSKKLAILNPNVNTH